MIIGVDCDGVIRDLHTKLIQVFIREHRSDEMYWCYDQWRWENYDIAEYFSIGDQIYDFWFRTHAEEIYSMSLPYEGCLEAFQDIYDAGHHLYIITSQPNNKIEVYTLEWLHKYEIPYFGIHFVHDKHLVDCDIYIDDSPQFIDLFNENGKKVVICDHRWNQSLIGYDRVGSFNDFAKNILEGKYE